MKYLLLILFAGFFNLSYAQDNSNNKKIFVRLYNSSNEKIGKGFLLYSNDSLINTKLHATVKTFPVQQVAYIETRRSAGHSILTAAAIGTATGIIVITAAAGAGVNNQDIAASLTGSAAWGAAIGGIAAALRKKETLNINGNTEQWKDARKKILGIN